MRKLFALLIFTCLFSACFPDKESAYQVSYSAALDADQIAISFNYTDLGVCSGLFVNKNKCKSDTNATLSQHMVYSLYDASGVKLNIRESSECHAGNPSLATDKSAICNFYIVKGDDKFAIDEGSQFQVVAEYYDQLTDPKPAYTFKTPKLTVTSISNKADFLQTFCDSNPNGDGCEVEAQVDEPDCEADPSAEGCDADGDGVLGSDDICPEAAEKYEEDGTTPTDGTLDGCDDSIDADTSTSERVVNLNDGGACAVNALSVEPSVSMWPYFLMTLMGLFALKKRRN